MATQEERLETLENDFREFKMETIKAYQDAAVDLTMIKGLAVDSIGRLKNIDRQFDIVELSLSEMRRDIDGLEVRLVSFEQHVDSRFEEVDKRFEEVDKRFDGVDKRFDGIDKRFDGIDKRLESHDKRFDDLDKRLESHDKRFDDLDKRLESHDKRFDGLEKKFDSLDNKFDQVLLMLTRLIPGSQQGT